MQAALAASCATSKRLNPSKTKAGSADQTGEQGELYSLYRYHAVFTDSLLTLMQAEKAHRGHAIIEQVHADLKAGPLAHVSSCSFAANSAWLVLAAILGLTVFVFQDLLGGDDLTFYVPFAAAMLLVSLGSDYNIFAVGRVWEAARHLPLREAVRKATPESSQAITAALTLAASFGLLALVPLRPFRELALAMTLGILLGAVVVRTLLVPCLLTLLGDRANRTIKHRAAARGGQRPAPGAC